MGTTLTAMLFSGGRAVLAHIGDSRAFRHRGGQLRPVTEDHTIGNLLADVGLLALVLARHLDGRPDRSAGTGLRAGGRYLLYFGGLSPVVDDRPLRNVLTLRAASADASADAASEPGDGPACPG
jgi:serine/threonine protein phosphatase PrpC